MIEILFSAILLLISLLGFYLYIEKTNRKALNSKQRVYKNRIVQTNKRLKLKLHELTNERLIRPKYSAKIQTVVANYFIKQAHNEENLQHLENIIDLLVKTLSSEFIKAQRSNSFHPFIKNVERFTSELPRQNVLYNKVFYRNTLPLLINKIKTSDLTQQSESKEKTTPTKTKVNTTKTKADAKVT